jgi:hypothetical protein
MSGRVQERSTRQAASTAYTGPETTPTVVPSLLAASKHSSSSLAHIGALCRCICGTTLAKLNESFWACSPSSGAPRDFISTLLAKCPRVIF